MNKMFRFVEAAALITMMLIPLVSLIQTATSADPNIVVTLQCNNLGGVKRTLATATVTLTQTGRTATLTCDTNLNFSAQLNFMPMTDKTFTALYSVSQDAKASACNTANAIAIGGPPPKPPGALPPNAIPCPKGPPSPGLLLVVLQ